MTGKEQLKEIITGLLREGKTEVAHIKLPSQAEKNNKTQWTIKNRGPKGRRESALDRIK